MGGARIPALATASGLGSGSAPSPRLRDRGPIEAILYRAEFGLYEASPRLRDRGPIEAIAFSIAFGRARHLRG